MRLLPVSLLLAACTGAPPDDTGSDDTGAGATDPAVVLLELATLVCADLYLAVHYTIGDSLLFHMEDGDTLSGTLTFPADADPEYWEGEGELAMNWTVSNRTTGDDTWRYWDWVIAVDITSLTLPSAEVSGTAAWTVTHEEWDSRFEEHAWVGDLSIDGATAVPVSWTGHGTLSSLNGMEGTIDGEPVAWENPDPDLP